MGLHLGRNDPVSAKRVMKLSMCISAGIAFAVGCMFFFGKAELGHLYSDDPKIWALSERIATLVPRYNLTPTAPLFHSSTTP